jgi:hypothetical protein
MSNNDEIGARTISGFCKWNSVGRTYTYGEIKSGRLEARKAGRKTLIFPDAEERWRRALPKLVTGKAQKGD